MKNLPTLLLAALPLIVVADVAHSASRLDIPAGQTYTVQADQQRLSLDVLTIGDDATVVFVDGIKQWYVRADQTQIGSNVVIAAAGVSGAAGQSGEVPSAAASECSDGASGGSGTDGTDGSNGVSVRLQLGFQSLGDLTIDTSGGAGGVGGTGGAGQDAGAFGPNCKVAPKGGNAGDGGNGGSGGTAGDISVTYWAAEPTLNVKLVANLISVESKGGAIGSAGPGGMAGKGSEGRYIKKKTLTGNRAWLGGGSEGAAGQDGTIGLAGADGRVMVEQALVSVRTAAPVQPESAKTPIVTVPAPAGDNRDAEIDAVKSELKSLLERLDKLQKSAE